MVTGSVISRAPGTSQEFQSQGWVGDAVSCALLSPGATQGTDVVRAH